MRKEALSVLGKTFDYQVNCFCISEFFYHQTQFRQSTADEMLNFVSQNFRQVAEDGPGVLTLIWSRSSFELGVGQIKVQDLAMRLPGFPFGLILEHSFVQTEKGMIFQKADPTVASKVELIPFAKALEPYLNIKGLELTRHTPAARF